MLRLNTFLNPSEIIDQQVFKSPGISIERASVKATERPPHYHDQHLLIVHQSRSVAVERYQGRRAEREIFHYGDVGIYPAGEYGKVSWSIPLKSKLIDNIFVKIDPSLLTEFSEINLGISKVTLKDRFLIKDSLIASISRSLIATQPDQSFERIYQESLCNTFYFHLLQHHSVMQSFRISEYTKLSEAE